ncbi:MAG: hypothetical protein ABIU09_05895 [Pyrinomonadaceae bacterium]
MNIAYQVIGSGDQDMSRVPGFLSRTTGFANSKALTANGGCLLSSDK